MKTINLIKQMVFATAVIAGMNTFSSCNSCDRKTQTTEESTSVTYESTTDGDTVSTDETSSSVNDGTTTSTSIKANSSGSGTATTTTKSTTTTTSSSASKNVKDEAARQQAITDRIENSDAGSAVDKNGNPIKSSGDAGSGMGTGTGSTGNNSRVTTREAQRN